MAGNRAFLAIVLVAGMRGEQAVTSLKLSQTIPLQGNSFHVQGVDVGLSHAWVTSVDKERRRGLLLEYALPAGRLVVRPKSSRAAASIREG